MKAIFSENVLKKIRKECALHPNEETGGMLIGKELNDEFIVIDFIGPGPNAFHSLGGFSYDPKYEIQEYEKLINENRSVELLGWVHRHPGDFNRPSGADLHQVNQMFDSEEWREWGFDVLLMPIVTMANNHFEIAAYIITKDEREFKRIPLEIVPESHPKIQALLSKEKTAEPDIQKTNNRLQSEISSLERLGLSVDLQYDENSRLVIISATLNKRPLFFYRDIFFGYNFQLEFRLHRSYPITKPAVFLTVKNHCSPINGNSEILKNWSPAHCLAHIVHFDFPNLIYPIRPFRRNHHGSQDF